MPIRSQRSVPRVGVSMLNVENSWASQVLASATTNIKDMARFQQRQLAEKEQKLLQLYDQQQLRAHQVAQRGSAGSNGSNDSAHGNGGNTSLHRTVTKTTASTHSTSTSQGGGKVRQMFDERRQTTVKGIDKSYPLEPLDNRSRKHQTVGTSNVSVNSPSPQKNANLASNRRTVVTRRTVRSEASGNFNDGKPVVSYREEISREISDSRDRDNEQEEFGDENFQASRYENGNRQIDQSSDFDIEDVANENITRRYETTAKINLTEIDRSDVTDRRFDNLDNERFSDHEIIETTERLPRSSTGKKSSLTETRLERPKNSNVKNIGQTTKRVAGNATSFTKKRNETTTVHSGSSSRASTMTRTTGGEISRASSTSPEFEGTKKPRNSSPELSDNDKKYWKSRYPTGKTSGITKVSQICHDNSNDYYPRRKSEFEKSKTFRKLQLELGESSPEPNEPEQVSSIPYGKQYRNRSSIYDENIYSSEHRSLSSSPILDRAYLKDREAEDREKSPERPESRRGSRSSSYRRESIVSNEETRTTRGGAKTASLESNTYTSRRRSSSSSPVLDHDFSVRKTSREIPQESSIYRRELMTRNEDREKTSGEIEKKNFESSTYSSRCHSSSRTPMTDRDFSKERKTSYERSESPTRSQSPIYRKEIVINREEIRKTSRENETSNEESSTRFSRRRFSTSSPIPDNDFSKERKRSYNESSERPESREGYRTYRRKSIVRDEERKSSSTYRSSSPTPFVNYDLSKERKIGKEISHERPRSRERSRESSEPRESIGKYDEKKSKSEGIRRSSLNSSTFSSRQRSSLTIPIERKTSEDKSIEHPESRRGYQSPNLRGESTLRCDMKKPTIGTSKVTNFDSSTYSSRQHSSSPIPIVDQCYSENRKTSHEISHERPESPERSQSPNSQRESYVSNEETKTTSGGITKREERRLSGERIKTSNFESSTFSSRCHSISPLLIIDHNSSGQRKTSREISPESSGSPRRSYSPIDRGESPLKSEEERETNNYHSRRRSSSSGPINDPDFPKKRDSNQDRDDSVTENRRKSVGTLRSFELLKKLVRSSESKNKPSPTSTTKITLQDIECPVESLNLRESTGRPKSPEHKIVKKDKAPMKTIRTDKTIKTRERKNSARSKTISPSPPSSGVPRETTSFRTKKIDRKISVDGKKIESKNRQEFNQVNLIRNEISPSNDGKNSRRSSLERAVKRHDTIKVTRPDRTVLKIDNDESSNREQDLSFDKKIGNEFRDKSQLLERIEKIRSTLSRSGRSDQNFQSKEFERTDSVESALRRFDSIGVETEHHVTVGVDETDVSSSKTTSENFKPSSRDKKVPVEEKICVKKIIKPLCKPAKIIVALTKTRPRKIETKTRVSSKEKLARVNLREKHAIESVKIKRKKSVTTTPRNSDNKMAAVPRESQKRATSMVKKSKLRSEESSGRGETAMNTDDSPLCKRKLFQDSESEIENEELRSMNVSTTIARTMMNDGPKLVEIVTRNNRENMTKSVDNILRSDSSLGESKIDHEPTKVLRSIEDIRKSIRRESQDFKRELNKFNTAMKKEVEDDSLKNSDSIVSSGIVSRVRITKTLKSGDREPVIKIERSTVKLPITHRVAKSPSPDIVTKRSTDGRAVTATSSTVSRRSTPSSPNKNSDAINRYGSNEFGNPGSKSSGRTSSSPASRETKNQREYLTTEYSDVTDGPIDNSEVTVTQIVSTVTTSKNNDSFVIDFNDDVSGSKENAWNRDKSAVRKRSSETSLTSQKPNGSPTSTTTVSRPTSALSTTSSAASVRSQSSRINLKGKMSTKNKLSTSNGQKGTPTAVKGPSSATESDGLAPCKICGRRFNSDRVTRHEQICSKTTTKKRKQFDATVHRVKGTELEPFLKKGGNKKTQADRKAQKPEIKSNWRRKHEDFINAIRSAKQVQAHIAAGGKLSDLPPPPPSDTSDYIQCPHCGRKFNQGAADRHIPKCQNMMHNKPNPRAPPKPKR